jgi:hypothetical protein
LKGEFTRQKSLLGRLTVVKPRSIKNCLALSRFAVGEADSSTDPWPAHSPYQADSESGEGGQNSYRRGGFVSQAHIRLHVTDGPHKKKDKAEERHRDKKADNSTDQAYCAAPE